MLLGGVVGARIGTAKRATPLCHLSGRFVSVIVSSYAILDGREKRGLVSLSAYVSVSNLLRK